MHHPGGKSEHPLSCRSFVEHLRPPYGILANLQTPCSVNRRSSLHFSPYDFSETYSRLWSFSAKRMRVWCCGRRAVSKSIVFEPYTLLRRFSVKRMGDGSSTNAIGDAKTRATRVFALALEFWTSKNLHDKMCGMHPCLPRCVCIHHHWMDSAHLSNTQT